MKTENISAFMDNEADLQVEKEMLSTWKTDSSVRDKWNEYHLISEIIKEREVHDFKLTNKIFDALADEPTIFVPKKNQVTVNKEPSINKWVAIAAAVFVVVISTQTFKQSSFRFGNNQIAQSNDLNSVPAAPNNSIASVNSNDVNSYVNLHRQLSPFTDIQTVDYKSGVVVSK
ncbi:MAG: hypothetical protein KGN31_05340 [Betaproteobacteria bacterium]|nr:sigma-E factor negative regulatory protein [Betaproteobacteria bacterium]MDE2423619.1 hypothetical protein [Betaproteobacteria bacterium]